MINHLASDGSHIFRAWEVRMKKLIILLAIGMAIGACTTTKTSKLSKQTLAEKALERQNLRR